MIAIRWQEDTKKFFVHNWTKTRHKKGGCVGSSKEREIMGTAPTEEGKSQAAPSAVQHAGPKRRKKQQPNRNSEKNSVARLLYSMYSDSRSVFKLKKQEHSRTFMTRREVMQLCQDQGKIPSDHLRIVPADPCLPAIGRNALLVRSNTRTSLCKLWRCTLDRVMYMQFLEKELRKGFH